MRSLQLPRFIPLHSVIAAIMLSLSMAFASGAGLRVSDLRCEQARNPLGVDVPAPALSWKLAADAPAQRQSAWQILAASSPDLLGREHADLWDSGRTASSEQYQIRYQGKPLSSLQQVFWKVRVWDADGQASDWSAPSKFTLGMLKPSDWRAQWIESPGSNQTILLRREFAVKPGLRRAVAVVCGLGHYEMTLNGRKSGDDLLAPGWTKYDKTCLYDTHDVTMLLREGRNAIGLELGNGMYNVPGGRYVKFKGSFGPLKAIAQVRIEYADGSIEDLVTDGSWRVAPGPITFSCVYGGEDFDARLEPEGWNRPGFDDGSWKNARVTGGPGGELRGHSSAAPAIRAVETLRPVAMNAISNGVAVYDLGQNASMMPRIRVSGSAGSRVRIIPAELVKTNGSVDRGSVSLGRPGWWEYTLRGGNGIERWFPKFFYHGARYLQVERMAASPGGELPRVESIEGVVVHSTAEPIGDFECSNDLFNRIRRLVRWAQRSNMASVLTDCPHRERLGWLEQYHLNGPAIRYEFDLNRMFAKGMNDMADCQLPNGCVPSIAPEYTVFGKGPTDVSDPFRNSPEWGSAIVLVPWQQYEFTGDTSLLERHYGRMQRYVDFLRGASSNHIVDFGLGDWYDLGPKPPGFAQLTPRGLTATAFYYQDADILARIAGLLGRTNDAARYQHEAEQVRGAFNTRFFNPSERSYATGSQCANAIPLVMNLVDAAHREAVLEALVRDVRSRTNSVTAGDVGYRYVLRALAEAGRSDVVFDMNNQSDRPGYGYQLRQGATSLTEAWNARRGSSQNHFMLGQIMEWFYHDLLGIQPDATEPGFKNVIIKPGPAGDVTWARGSYETVRGPVSAVWSRTGARFALEISVPPNCTATVVLPGEPARLTGAARKWAREEKDARATRHFRVPSGRYHFESRL